MQATLNKLEDKYKDNPYMLKKLHDHITENLEPLLDSIEQNFNSRQERKNDMTDTMTEFSNHFLKNKNLYYCNHRELFFNYENDHYVIYNEDDIIHDILKLIHRDSKLFSWKFKVKNTLIKQIKDRNVYNSIPESNTIQSIIKQLFPLLFPSKNWAKYFLTIIGDLLLKKEIQQNLIYFFTYENKDLIKQIAIICNNNCGVNLHNHFKFKYHDHAYENCRLISCNKTESTLLELFKKNAMDFLCVATHYSNRYINSEHFLAILRDKKLKLHALYLKENNVNDITNDFLKTSMITNDNSKISFKNVVFVWKKYLQLKHLPNIIFHQNLISQLKEKLKYDNDNNVFLNITSLYSPVMNVFLDFWEKNMVVDENEIEFETPEILSLIYKHSPQKNLDELDETLLLEMIKHYYPDVIIEEHKYITQFSCKLWDKSQDILTALNEYKKKTTNIGAYEYYCQFFKDKNLVASKRYFDKFVSAYAF